MTCLGRLQPEVTDLPQAISATANTPMVSYLSTHFFGYGVTERLCCLADVQSTPTVQGPMGEARGVA